MERQTSGVLFSFYSKSQYHERCVPPKTTNAPPSAAEISTPTNRGVQRYSPVKQELIWKQALEKEESSRRQWEVNWGFLADYDPKGNLKPKRELPARSTVFTDAVPMTNAQNYGSRLDTSGGRQIRAMEQRFYAERRKRPIDKDITIA